MGYPTWRSNTNLIYTNELTVGKTPILAGPASSITDSITLKARKTNQGTIYVAWQGAGAAQIYALEAAQVLANMRVTGFDVFRVYASTADQILHVYAELGETQE